MTDMNDTDALRRAVETNQHLLGIKPEATIGEAEENARNFFQFVVCEIELCIRDMPLDDFSSEEVAEAAACKIAKYLRVPDCVDRATIIGAAKASVSQWSGGHKLTNSVGDELWHCTRPVNITELVNDLDAYLRNSKG